MAFISGIESLGTVRTAQILFDGFIAGCAFHRWAGSYVGGLQKPGPDSSRAYRHYFDTCHLLFNRATHTSEK